MNVPVPGRRRRDLATSHFQQGVCGPRLDLSEILRRLDADMAQCFDRLSTDVPQRIQFVLPGPLGYRDLAFDVADECLYALPLQRCQDAVILLLKYGLSWGRARIGNDR